MKTITTYLWWHHLLDPVPFGLELSASGLSHSGVGLVRGRKPSPPSPT